jgi:hypothetical protein
MQVRLRSKRWDRSQAFGNANADVCRSLVVSSYQVEWET